jgi:hypothetical protein
MAPHLAGAAILVSLGITLSEAASEVSLVVICGKTEVTVDKFVRAAGVSVAPISTAPWIYKVERRLPVRLPPSFSSLVTRYAFPDFVVGPIRFLANRGDGAYGEFAETIFRDPNIWRVSSSSGFIQFARPADGSYDPLCFDTRKRPRSREFPVVRLDHEAMLQFEKIRIVSVVASSLLDFMEEHAGRQQAPGHVR